MKITKARINRALLTLIGRLRMARARREPAYIDRNTMTIALPTDYDPFAMYAIGTPFGKYGERITNRVIAKRSDPLPFWFAPKTHANHIAFVSPYDSVCYLEITLNRNTRDEMHPFTRSVEPIAEPTPEPLLLFQI